MPKIVSDLRVHLQRFLVESTKVENAIFLYKTGLSEANFKTNRNGVYKIELSQSTAFCQELLYFLGNFVSV